ncbi:MAG: C45 family autoproteolytic acyltransferase/hydrolase [Anaerolineales bacterium]
MSVAAELLVVRARGAPRVRGRQIGEAAAPFIQQMVTTYRLLIEGSQDRLKLSWAAAVSQSRKYSRYALDSYMEELRGMAEGANVSLDDLLMLNCAEALVEDALHLKCTSLALGPEWTEDRHVLLAHNEDWWPQDEHTLYLIHAEPEHEPPFLALTAGGLLPAIGLNAAGLAQCCDSVYPNDSRVGVPRAFVARSVLGAPDLAEAARRAAHPDREAGYNHLVINREGEILSLEASALSHATLPDQAGALVHTNHYLDPAMQQVERDPAGLDRSRLRHDRATELLHSGRPHSRHSLARLLADHHNSPSSICSHVQESQAPLDQYATIASVIIDLTEMTLHVARGQPCGSPFSSYAM